MLFVVALAAATTPRPDVQLVWKGADHHLTVIAPEGHELAPDAPTDLRIEWPDGVLAFAGLGMDLADVPTPDLREKSFEGALSVTLCAKADGTCAPSHWTLSGTGGAGRKGLLDLVVAAPAAVGHSATDPFNQPADATIEAAFAEAKATGKPLLLDFSAVWCPPCNLLGAEVLHAATPPAVLEDYVVAVVDVDHPSSFALKSRYAVGGYPTVVVADPDGTERSRTVGYPGKRAFLDWLATAATSTDAADIAAGAAAVSPERALELAWLLLSDRRFEDAAPFIARGEGVDSALARRVRTTQTPAPDDVRWLLEHDLDHIGDWFGVAMDLAESEPDLASRVAREAIRRLDGPALADAFYVRAKVSGNDADYEAAASALRTAMTGDPEADRGHITWLAQLTAYASLEEGLQILDEARARWLRLAEGLDAYAGAVDDPVSVSQLALVVGRIVEAGAHERALEAAQRAQQTAWGDNALRAAHAAAEALLALDRPDEAIAVIEAALAAPAPDDGVSVRTHRYRSRLEALRP